MTLRFAGLADGRLWKARKAVKRLSDLGFTKAEIVQLIRTQPARARRSGAPATAGRRERAQNLRRHRAIWAIRTLIALGFNECEIAYLVGVDHTTISHLLNGGPTRNVSEETTAALQDAVQHAGVARLKQLLPRLEIQVLETACDKGHALNASVGAQTAESVRRLIRNAILFAAESAVFPPGIHAALAQVGDPKQFVFVFAAEALPNDSLEARVVRLRELEHESEHVVQRFRVERKRLERQLRRQEEPPKEGGIA